MLQAVDRARLRSAARVLVRSALPRTRLEIYLREALSGSADAKSENMRAARAPPAKSYFSNSIPILQTAYWLEVGPGFGLVFASSVHPFLRVVKGVAGGPQRR